MPVSVYVACVCVCARALHVRDCAQIMAGSWGDVDRVAFRGKVRELGVSASDMAIDATFAQIDTDGGGTLDEEEVRQCSSCRTGEGRRERGSVLCCARALTRV